MQIWGQSPRQWARSAGRPHDVAEFRELLDGGPVKSVVIHAIYLINCASKDTEIRGASRWTRSMHALAAGDASAPPAWCSTRARPRASPRGGAAAGGRGAARGARRVRPLRPPARGHRRRRRHHRPHLRGAGRADRLCRRAKAARACAWTPATCWPSGFDIRTADKLTEVIDDCEQVVGTRPGALPARERLADPAGLQPRPPRPARRRRAGRPRLRGVPLASRASRACPAIFEGPGKAGKGAEKEDVDRLKELRRSGRAARRRRSRVAVRR